MLFKGFKGIGIANTSAGGSSTAKFFRFTSADFSIEQGITSYTPSYGGSELRRIISPNTSTINGRISIILPEKTALYFYTKAYSAEEMKFDIYYRDGRVRRFTGAKIDNLSFSCRAGEFVQLSIDVICKDWSQDGSSSSGATHTIDLTKTFSTVQKLVDWTKVGLNDIFKDDDKASLSYNIKNNLVVIKTGASLNPYVINQGVQEVSGDISIYEARLPNYGTDKYEVYVPTTSVQFLIDDLIVSHLITNHWSFRTPLTPDLVVTTLDWTRVDTMT